jgi:hypothetical protein
MKTTYVIDADNKITLFGAQDTNFDGEIFSSESELLGLTEKWPEGRLLEVRNSIPGIETAGKVNSSKKVVAMIWRMINQLMPIEPDGALKPKGNSKATKKLGTKRAPAAKKGKAPKPPKTEGKRTTSGRRASKKAMVLGMIQRKGGATLEEIVDKTGWQKHTVRGFMATVPAKIGLKLKSEKVDGHRTYSAA